MPSNILCDKICFITHSKRLIDEAFLYTGNVGCETIEKIINSLKIPNNRLDENIIKSYVSNPLHGSQFKQQIVLLILFSCKREKNEHTWN